MNTSQQPNEDSASPYGNDRRTTVVSSSGEVTINESAGVIKIGRPGSSDPAHNPPVILKEKPEQPCARQRARSPAHMVTRTLESDIAKVEEAYPVCTDWRNSGSCQECQQNYQATQVWCTRDQLVR